ncbi:hypothetical protein [Halanaeroarchaeum sulfurireducens]|uniref:hypothetical protein n=1 Tax=Halanaeroarchaeum sulfurireducens TaxID=1604004 RepID=UPI00118743FE|nr:hypothetical protein [Halanaeroarchaeum sulfurireducens]
MNVSRVSATGISVVGIGLGGAQVVGSAISIVGAFTTFPFVLMSAALVYTGYWLARSSQYGTYADRVLIWTGCAAGTFAAVALLVLMSMNGFAANAVPTSPLADMLTAGALAGALVGLYDAQSRERLVALETERDRVEAFARKAESLNRYGKALNQSRDVYEVSALSIEVLELLIGSRDAAVVLVDDETTVVDSTIPDQHRSFLERAAETMAPREPMQVTRCPQDVDMSLPSALDGAEIVAVPVPTGTDGRMVLMALPGAEDPYTEEDLDSLASLSAHVGTAISSVQTDDALSAA